MAMLPTKALSKGELNSRNDKKVDSRYRHRLSIDQWHRDRQLSRDLAEVWDD